MSAPRQSAAPQALSAFDRLLNSLADRNDTQSSRESVVRFTPLWGVGGGTETFIVHTTRVKDEGDYVFVQCVSEGGTVRLALPPAVAALIARQRDQLSAKSRSRAARTVAQERMERGEKPAFLKAVKS